MVHRALVLCLLVAVVIGCGSGGDELERVILSGAVTYQGEPVADGSVLFVPCDGTVGSSMAVKVIDSRYRADSHGGVPVGNYRVEILAYRKNTGSRQPVGPMARTDLSDHANAPEQYLPEKYNVKSQLKTVVEAGSKSVTQDFALVE